MNAYDPIVPDSPQRPDSQTDPYSLAVARAATDRLSCENALLRRLADLLKALLWDNGIDWELELMKYGGDELEELLQDWRKASYERAAK